jgi:hypothetical protein
MGHGNAAHFHSSVGSFLRALIPISFALDGDDAYTTRVTKLLIR